MPISTTRKELAEVIGEKTLHMQDREALVNGVAAYISTSRQSIDLDSLMRDIMQYRLEHGIVEAIAVSAHEVDTRVIKDIEDLLREHFTAAKSFLVDTRIDPNIIGGVRIELPQENLDLSIKSKLNTFKRLVADERN